MLTDKPLGNITLEDIRTLISAGQIESNMLEYKRELHLEPSDQKREF